MLLLFFNLLLSLFTLTWAGSEAKPRVNGHADGETQVDVVLVVLDAGTQKPVSGASVIFFRKAESAMLDVIEAERRSRGSSDRIEPKGTIGITDQEGRVALRCWFAAAFLSSNESGNGRDVGTHVFPSGRFRISKSGYARSEQSSRDPFSFADDSKDWLTGPAVVRFSITPNSEGSGVR